MRFVAAALALALAVGAGGCAADGPEAASDSPPAAMGATMLNNGVWSAGEFHVAADPYAGPLAVPAGFRTVALSGRVLNRSDKPLTFSMLLGLKLRSADGTQYRPVGALASGDSPLDGPVPANGALSGLVAFNVPAGDVGPWTVALSADLLAPAVWLNVVR